MELYLDSADIEEIKVLHKNIRNIRTNGINSADLKTFPDKIIRSPINSNRM